MAKNVRKIIAELKHWVCPQIYLQVTPIKTGIIEDFKPKNYAAVIGLVSDVNFCINFTGNGMNSSPYPASPIYR